VVVAHFYDIESGRTDLALRGRGHAHEAFDIPIPRDGGIQDLLAEADRPDRRFDVVVCESIDRISRRTYYGTMIEHRLEQAGVGLFAADEPFTLDPAGGRARTATQVLTRRVKQGVSEWYVRDMLEKSWDGFAVHTELGYNIGKPCYGYTARRVPHPVPAKRAKGAKKTYLDPDPVQAPVVRRTFAMRVTERLGYQAIADHLNKDLATNPPPTPVDPTRAVGRWTYSNVREILTNPKHTGHMVWNRHARKSGHNRANPATDWVWSPEPTHQALVDLETFIQAQQVAAHRFGSRTNPGPSRHPETKRAYPLRTYLFCHACGRRMFGKTRRQTAYYACAPKKGLPTPRPPGQHLGPRRRHPRHPPPVPGPVRLRRLPAPPARRRPARPGRDRGPRPHPAHRRAAPGHHRRRDPRQAAGPQPRAPRRPRPRLHPRPQRTPRRTPPTQDPARNAARRRPSPSRPSAQPRPAHRAAHRPARPRPAPRPPHPSPVRSPPPTDPLRPGHQPGHLPHHPHRRHHPRRHRRQRRDRHPPPPPGKKGQPRHERGEASTASPVPILVVPPAGVPEQGKHLFALVRGTWSSR